MHINTQSSAMPLGSAFGDNKYRHFMELYFQARTNVVHHKSLVAGKGIKSSGFPFGWADTRLNNSQQILRKYIKLIRNFSLNIPYVINRDDAQNPRYLHNIYILSIQLWFLLIGLICTHRSLITTWLQLTNLSRGPTQAVLTILSFHNAEKHSM